MPLDIGVGLLLAVIVGVIAGISPSAPFLLIGLIGALWPDLDAIWYVLQHKKVDQQAHQHRDLLHRPLVLIPPLTAVVWALLGWPAGTLFGLASLAHFVDDFFYIGWGVRLFSPFDDRHWCYRPLGEEPWQLLVITKKEQDALSQKYGDPNWLVNIYGTWNWYSILNLIVLLAGIVAVTLWYLTSAPYS